jgi:quercetin dioxygenase-like cupin family protein
MAVDESRDSSAPLPRVLVNTGPAADLGGPDAAGAVWALRVRDRDLDANVIAIPPGGVIDAHAGPDLDVLIHVLRGSGSLTTEAGSLDLEPGALAWLPRRSRREFTAGPDGLRYLTVHRRRQALVLDTAARPPDDQQ